MEGLSTSKALLSIQQLNREINRQLAEIEVTSEGYKHVCQAQVILLEQIRTLDKQRLEKYVGRLSKKHLNDLNHALAISVGLIPAQENLVLCLCKPCADNFRLDGRYDLVRVTENQVRDTCTYCNYRMGVEYELVPREV